MAPALDGVVFDLGNVLVFHDNALLFRRLGDALGCAPEALARVLDQAGWERMNRGDLDAEGIRRTLCEAVGGTLAPDVFLELWSCHFTPNPPMLAYAEELLSRTKVLLLSNTNAAHVDWLLPRYPLLRRFHAVLLSCELRLVKPERAIFAEAAKRAGAPPERLIFFDDIPEYVHAARAAGLRAEVFTDAATTRAVLEPLLA